MQSDLVDDLCFLNEEYAYMLTVLERTEIPKDSFNELKVFLSRLCKRVPFEGCSSLKCVIDVLELNGKIFQFNIEPLIACCSIRPNHLYKPFFKSKVCSAVLDYRRQIENFLKSVTLQNFEFSLRRKLKNVKDMAEVTLKLSTIVSSDTADILQKLPYQLFGVTSKALILCKVGKGCVCVTWCVPSSLVPTLREKAEQLSPEYLASKGVLELVIGLRIAPNEGLCVMIYSYYCDLSLYIAAALSGHTASSLAQVDAASRDVNIATGKAGEYMHTWMVCI